MPPRAATGRSRTAVASSSRAKASTSAPRRRSRKQPTTAHAKGYSQHDDDDDAQSDADDVNDDARHDGSQSITGPILMDDDEEDELGLRSPVKIVEAPTVKPNRVGGGVAGAKGKAVFGTAKGVNTLATREDPEEVDDADDVTSSKRSSRQPKTKAVRVGRKPNNTTAHPRVKALAASSKPRKPAAFVDSSDEEVDVEVVDAEEVENTPRSADGVSMPEEQIQHFLHGYDLDAANRLDRLRNHLTVTLESARSQMSIILSRLPMAARSLTLTDFLELHESDVKKVVGRGVDTSAGSQVDDADGWEEMKRKRPRAKENGEEDGNMDKGKRGKTARRNATASSPAKPSSTTRQLSSRTADKKAGPSSGRPVASSGPPAPSSATFSPRLNSATRTMPVPLPAVKTPARAPAAAGRASRLAKIGEQIQMYSLNGSPITGFIGPDGRLRYLPRPGADYADQDDDAAAADAAPALPPISKSGASDGTKNLQAASALASILPKQGEASSSRALPSSPAPQRSAPFGSSLGGTSSLQPRFDDDTSAAAAQSNSSPLRPSSRAGGHFSSSLGMGMGMGLADESNELPDEEAYMREIMAQEEQKRREAAGRSATLQHKSSASRLMAKFGAGGGGGSGSSNGGGTSSRPPSSPAPASSSYSARSAGGAFRSSSPSKAAPVSRGTSLMKPTSSSKPPAASTKPASSSAASGRGGKQRLSLINARGEVVPIEDIREEDVPVEQKAQLARMFQRLGMGLGIGGSPKKR